MGYITKLSVVASLLLLSACACDLSWDGVCKHQQGGYDSYRELYQSYNEQRMHKIVPGLGGALYNSY